MNEGEALRDDEISLFDLWDRLRDGWKAVAGGLVLGIAGAVAGIVMIPPKYEAVLVVQVGNVGGQPVEAPAQAMERLKMLDFQRRVAEALNDQERRQTIARSAMGASKAPLVKMLNGTALIELRVEGDSPEAVKRSAEGTVAELAKVHGELARPVLKRLQADMVSDREKLASVERRVLSLSKLVETSGVVSERFPQLVLMTSLLIQKEADAFAQRQLLMVRENALESPATEPTRAIEAVFVREKPVSPKALQLALGCVVGLLAGVLWVLMSDAWRRARDSNSRR